MNCVSSIHQIKIEYFFASIFGAYILSNKNKNKSKENIKIELKRKMHKNKYVKSNIKVKNLRHF